MKKIYLTEEQFREYLKRELAESVYGTSEAYKQGKVTGRSISSFARKMQDPVFDRLAKTYRGEVGNDELTQNLHNLSDEHGVDMRSFAGQETSADYNARRQETINGTSTDQINQWVKQYLPILRKCYTAGGNITDNFQKGFEHKVGDQRDAQGNLKMINTPRFFDTLDMQTKKEVMAVRDFLDGEGLTFLYREAPFPKWPIRYGITPGTGPDQVNWNTPVEELGNLDFGNISDYDANEYYDGTRIPTINKQLSQYEKDSPEWLEGKRQIGIAGRTQMTIERYVERRYGMEMTYGKDPKLMKFGNAKIADDTLIVNFTSATRCPAWNECLLKDACYARVGELGHPDTRDKNNRNSIIWSQTEKDDTLLNLMAQFIRACMVDYPSVASAMKKQFKVNVTPEALVALKFSDIQAQYGDDVINLIRSYSSQKAGKAKSNRIIRLNEDGDFIGQWLVNAWEEWARDFQLIGVTVAAYTCRALNYENIEAMALNMSQQGLNSEYGNVSHYFYAINENLYEGLPETYINETTGDNTLDARAKNIIPRYVTLEDNEGVKGYYYKCPCGRGKYVYTPCETSGKKKPVAVNKDPRTMQPDNDDPAFVTFGNELFQKTKTEYGNMADCYKCRICYGRAKEQQIQVDRPPMQKGVPVYVFVKVHGSGGEKFDAEHANVRKPGGRTVEEWVGILGGGQPAQQEPMIAEAEMPGADQNDPAAIKQLVANATMSVANHMSEMGMYLDEAEERFYHLFDQIDR